MSAPLADHQFHIRLLTRADGPAYSQLRLRSLQEDGDVFLSSFDTESQLHEDAFASHLDYTYHPPHFGYFGIFVEEKLAGYVQVGKTYLDKQEHIALMNNLYIAPEYRGLGLAKKVFAHVFDLLEKSEKVERLYLTCAARNKKALHLYQDLGFRRFAVRAKSIKWQGEYGDEVEMVKILKTPLTSRGEN
jgi:RimJ/RimL family protein N-acetyltransferase